jgi:hypothetical protein
MGGGLKSDYGRCAIWVQKKPVNLDGFTGY